MPLSVPRTRSSSGSEIQSVGRKGGGFGARVRLGMGGGSGLGVAEDGEVEVPVRWGRWRFRVSGGAAAPGKINSLSCFSLQGRGRRFGFGEVPVRGVGVVGAVRDQVASGIVVFNLFNWGGGGGGA